MRNRIFLSNIGPKMTEREKFYEELEESRTVLGPLEGTNIGKQILKRLREEQAGNVTASQKRDNTRTSA